MSIKNRVKRLEGSAPPSDSPRVNWDVLWVHGDTQAWWDSLPGHTPGNTDWVPRKPPVITDPAEERIKELEATRPT